MHSSGRVGGGKPDGWGSGARWSIPQEVGTLWGEGWASLVTEGLLVGSSQGGSSPCPPGELAERRAMEPEMTLAMLPWQPWGLEKEVSSHCPRPGWGGGPVFEPELCQGSWLPLSMSRCGLMEATCPAPWAGERGSDVCCHSGDLVRGPPLPTYCWGGRTEGGSQGLLPAALLGPRGGRPGAGGPQEVQVSPSWEGLQQNLSGPPDRLAGKGPLPRDPQVTSFCRAVFGCFDILVNRETLKLQ